MYLAFDTPSRQLPPQSDIAQLPALLQQAATDLNDPAVACLLVVHYDERTNHPCYRHSPAAFAIRADEA